MDEWISTPLGRYLVEREQAYFDQVVADIFGFNALQIGFAQLDLLRANRMPMRFAAAPQLWNFLVFTHFHCSAILLLIIFCGTVARPFFAAAFLFQFGMIKFMPAPFFFA